MKAKTLRQDGASKGAALEAGKRLSHEEATAYADEIIKKMYARWQEKIFQGPFMRDLRAGRNQVSWFKYHWTKRSVPISSGAYGPGS